jgi:hypothetical protein
LPETAFSDLPAGAVFSDSSFSMAILASAEISRTSPDADCGFSASGLATFYIGLSFAALAFCADCGDSIHRIGWLAYAEPRYVCKMDIGQVEASMIECSTLQSRHYHTPLRRHLQPKT